MSDTEEKKMELTQPTKSSVEILNELFSTFDAEPPLIIKTEKEEKKSKKSKKKHKHKDKKRKKKEKKRKRDDSISEHAEVDLQQLLIKQERQSPDKKIKLEKVTENINFEKEDKTKNCDVKDKPPKITIKNIKFSSIFEATIKEMREKVKAEEEDGELFSSDEDHKKKKHKKQHKQDREKKKHSRRSLSKDHSKSNSKRSKSPISISSKECDLKSKNDCKNDKAGDTFKSKDEYRSEDRQDDYCRESKYKDDYRDLRYKDDYRETKYKEDREFKYRDSDRDLKYKEKESYKSRNYDDSKKSKYNPFYREESSNKHRDDCIYEYSSEKFRERYRGHGDYEKERDYLHRNRSSSRDRIDKKKLLEIARRNAIQMMKSGSLPAALTLGPQAQEKVLAAIRAGGKTIEELTDFCKTLSKKEELGELSSVSGDDDDSETEKAFHHPFQIKDRPTSIVMNIKNSVQLPTKTAQERSAELRIQFPVSSGTQHRRTENEWVPVTPKKSEPTPAPPVILETPALPPLPLEAPPLPPEPPAPPPAAVMPPPVFHSANSMIDIGSIVSQRLQAMRKLQENPYDVQALNEMHKSQREMQTWAESKQQPGQFTGSTGASILSQAELSSGYQAWARKDQLQNAAPVSGGMGMHLLRKMGWNPGEGLGKEKSGALEPLLLEVKLDKKGLVANEEQKRRQQKQKNTIKTLEGKHPVSLLGEYTAKRKLGAPQYVLIMESGPDHKKMFLFKVIVNGVEYQTHVASPNKKQAKADAAKLCLQQMGLLLP